MADGKDVSHAPARSAGALARLRARFLSQSEFLWPGLKSVVLLAISKQLLLTAMNFFVYYLVLIYVLCRYLN